MGRKWNNIKEKKASKDKNTSRIYAKFGREIYVAAKQGEPDPESNQALKVVLERAKTYNVPRAIVDRAIEKAKGGADSMACGRASVSAGVFSICTSNSATSAGVTAMESPSSGFSGVPKVSHSKGRGAVSTR